MNNATNFEMGIPKLVTLSWNSITVTASTKNFLSNFNKKSSEPQKKTILKSVDGFIKPGQMLGLLGARL
jgi:ABC-type multidrug transport system ATPase subunit